jgi:Peroxidase
LELLTSGQNEKISGNSNVLLFTHAHICFQAGGPSWSVELGRRDGTVSSASDVSSLPAPTDSVDVQRQKFSDKGLSDHDLVTLVGTSLIFL